MKLDRAKDTHIAILTQQVSNYHAARFRCARETFRRVTVLSVLNAADFKQFLAGNAGDDTLRVCDGDADYAAAVSDGSLWRRVKGALQAVSPDVVAVAGWSFPESLSAIAWARSNERPVVLMSASQAEDGTRSPWRESVKGRVVKACDAALVAAERHKAYAVALGLAPERVFYGYDAVDNAYFIAGAEAAKANAAEVRAAEGLPQRYLLASGRFIGKKNFPRLVKAFATALEKADHGHDLVILGDGLERDAIEAAISATGMGERVHLPGYRSYHHLPAYYGLSDGFLHVSLTEQWGLVVNEAAAAGLPIVISRPCGAAATLVRPGRNGTIVDPYDINGIAAAIAAVMALAPEERAAMGGQSRAIVADWGPERFASGLASAAEAGLASPRRALCPSDRILFKAMARMRISTVS